MDGGFGGGFGGCECGAECWWIGYADCPIQSNLFGALIVSRVGQLYIADCMKYSSSILLLQDVAEAHIRVILRL
jgi:hypothetical protein